MLELPFFDICFRILPHQRFYNSPKVKDLVLNESEAGTCGWLAEAGEELHGIHLTLVEALVAMD